MNAQIEARIKKVQSDMARREKLLKVVNLLVDKNKCAEVIELARGRVEQWRKEKLCSVDYIKAWTDLLDDSDEAAYILSSEGQYATQLQQNNPFIDSINS